MSVRLALCVVVFLLHFLARDPYADWVLAPNVREVAVEFLPYGSASLPPFVDRSHPQLWEKLACGPHSANTGTASQCMLQLPSGSTSISPEAISRLQEIAIAQRWPVNAQKLAFVDRVLDPAREWKPAIMLWSRDILVAIILALLSRWSVRSDLQAARAALRDARRWWVLAPLAGGALYSLASHAGWVALSTLPFAREILWPGFIALAVVAPLCEELIYRGWIHSLRPSLPAWAFAAITSVLFAISHGAIGGATVYYVFSGVLLALVMHRTRSVVLAMLAHVIHNVVAAM